MTTQDEMLAHLNAFVEREYDALSALYAAEDHLERPKYRTELDALLEAHRQHVQDLGDLIVARGGAPPVHGDSMELVRKGKVMLAALGGEQLVLVAMKSNADALANMYQSAVPDRRWTERERRVLERLVASQQLHSKRVENALGLHPQVGESVMAEERASQGEENDVSVRVAPAEDR